ncbi:regulatory protein RecX [Frigoribacterium sp. PhB24]|uniref:regulatory protein RecX n=1 Tax=Frigoribacterium sp. PhB24 TaxID=2485204 RepID=UPI000F4670D2|nr:regulatory protein RecX [Frigoribacterium sp. PhB24]ROS48542.1 regulatory protein [Frigoribacterium sp. PhB24]
MTSHDDDPSVSGPSADGTDTGRLAPVTPLFGDAGGSRVAEMTDDTTSPGRSTQGAEGVLTAISAHWVGGTSSSASEADHPSVRGSRAGAAGRPKASGFDDQPDDGPEDLEAQQRRAENVSLHALSRRGVSSHEMEKLLLSRDLDESVVAHEIARLERVGLLDDTELAATLVRSKQERKGLGRGAVTSELRARGIDPSVIDEALSDTDDDEEQERADEWARKRAGSLRGLDRETAERRLNGYLMRRGYRSEVVRRAIEKALPRGGSARGGVRFE